MKKIIIINFCLFFLIASCQKKKQVKNIISTNNSENIEIKKDTMPDLDIKSMKEMLEKEYDNIDSDTPSTAKTILWMNSEIYKALIKNGYKVPTKSNFESKIKTIFNINVNQPSSCSKIEINENHILIYGKRGFEIEKEKIFRSKFYPYDATENIFLMRKEHFINFVLSPIALVIFPIDSTSYKVKIPQYVISRNRYLFNDDQSQFSWLISNDEYFMESLVTTFGYTKDQKLLKWVMEKNYNQAEDFVKNNVFVKDCQNKLEIREDILNYIEASTNDKEYQYAKQLLNLSDRNDWKNFSDEEYFKILAYMANTFDPLSEKYSEVGMETHAKWSILGKEYYERKPEQWNQLIKEFKKNNYYGLPNLKHALKQAESYGDISIEVAQ